MAVDTVEKFGVGDPVPRQACLHRGIGNGFGPRHGQHRTFAQIRLHRCKTETAVANDKRGDAMPTRHSAVRIPEELSIVMSVKIDEAGSDIQPAGVNGLFSLMGLQITDLGDLAVLDTDIRTVARHPCAVDYRATSDGEIEFRHVGPSN